MKKHEELEKLKSEYNEACIQIAEHSESDVKQIISDLDKKLTELSEDELKEISAGTAFTAGTYAYSTFKHNNCGGTIHNVGIPWRNCYCDCCGEEHYWLYSFDFTEVYEK